MALTFNLSVCVQLRLAQMEQDERDEEERKKQEGQARADEAKRKADARRNRDSGDLEDSEVVDDVFGFLGDKDDRLSKV